MSSRSGKVTKVPLWGALGEASRQVFGRGQLKRLVRAGWIPFLILTLYGVATQLTYSLGLGPPIVVNGRANPNLQTSMLWMTVGLGSFLVQIFCYCAFVVSWYRTVLQASENARTERGYWSAFWRVLGYYLLAFVALVIALIPSSAVMVGTVATRRAGASSTLLATLGIGGAMIVIAILGCLLLITRFSLVFPAAAYGNRLGLRASWRRMRGNTWRLIGALFLITLLAVAIQAIPAFAFNGGAVLAAFSGRPPQLYIPPPGLAIGMGVVFRCVQFLFIALATSITAIFFREIVLRPGPEVVEVFA